MLTHATRRPQAQQIFDVRQEMHELVIPYIAERFLGVTIPDGGVMYACSYSGLHKFTLEDMVSVETDASGSEDYDLLKSKGDTLGIFGGAPILEDARFHAFRFRRQTAGSRIAESSSSRGSWRHRRALRDALVLKAPQPFPPPRCSPRGGFFVAAKG